MAVNVKTLRDWLATLNPDADVAIDDGGLTLFECGGAAYLEIGGEEEPAALADGHIDDCPIWCGEPCNCAQGSNFKAVQHG